MINILNFKYLSASGGLTQLNSVYPDADINNL